MQTGVPAPYDFVRFREYLEACLHAPKRRRSLNWVTQRLGYQSPRLVAMVLKGQRLPSADFVLRLADLQKLNVAERRYLELLVLQEKQSLRGAKTSDPRLIDEMKRVLMDRPLSRVLLQEERLRMISSWRHWLVRELVADARFDGRLDSLLRSVAGKMSASELAQVLAHLERAGVTARDMDGKIRVVDIDAWQTTDDVPSSAQRAFHRDSLYHAIGALESQPVEAREFRSLLIRTRTSDLPKLKERMRDFFRRVDHEFFCEEGDAVYQVNLNASRLDSLSATAPPIQS